jgi:hypothetical protein
MLQIGLLLLVIAAALLILAVRGRVVARGVFCRRCRFDLTGLDRSPPEAACPECGGALARWRSTTPVLRSPRWSLVGASVILALTAAVFGVIQIPAFGAWLLPRVPDAQLVWLDRLEVRGASDEVNIRLSDPLADHSDLVPLVQVSLDALFASGADAPVEHSDRVLAAVAGAQLTEEQTARLFQAIIQVEAAVRDHAEPDAKSVPSSVSIRFAPDAVGLRPDPANGQPTAYTLLIEIDQGGPVADGAIFDAPTPRVFSRDKQITVRPSIFTFHNMRTILPDSSSDRSSESVNVHVGVRLRVVNPRTNAKVSVMKAEERENVRLGERPAAFVELPTLDPTEVERFARSLRVAKIDTTVPVGKPDRPRISCFVRYTMAPPADAAFSLRVHIPHAEPIDTDTTLLLDAEEPVNVDVAGLFLSFEIPAAPDASGVNPAEQWRATETIDLVFVPDPDAAYSSPSLGPILPISLIIRDIPVIHPGEKTAPSKIREMEADPRVSERILDPTLPEP